jgi:hypothetical protein
MVRLHFVHQELLEVVWKFPEILAVKN